MAKVWIIGFLFGALAFVLDAIWSWVIQRDPDWPEALLGTVWAVWSLGGIALIILFD